MKKNTKIVSIVGAGLVLSIVAFFGVNFFSKEDGFEINAANVSAFEKEEATYYLKKAPKDIAFDVSTTEETDDISYTLVDMSGEEVEAVIEEKGTNSCQIRPANVSYTEGARYTLTLGPNVHFDNEHLAKAETLVFAIDREPIEQATFAEAVTQVEETVSEIEEDQVKLPDFQGKTGDLVFGVTDEEEEVVYKVTEAKDEDHFQVELPALDEIYTDLEIYGEYPLDLDNAIANPTLEAEIAQNIRESTFYSSLVKKAYAEEEADTIVIDVEIFDDAEENTLDYAVELTLKPNVEGVFGETKFAEHEITLLFNHQLNALVDLNIQNISDWDVAITRQDHFEWDVEVAAIDNDEVPLANEPFTSATEADIQEIVEILQTIEADELVSEIELFEHEFSLPDVPGFKINTAINLPVQFDFNANTETTNEYSTLSTVGLSFINEEFKPYSYIIHENEAGEASLQGRYQSRLNSLTAMKMQFFHEDIAHVSLRPEIGLFSDGYAAVPLDDAVGTDEKTYGYFEQFLSFNAQVESQIQLQDELYEFSDVLEEQWLFLADDAFGDSQFTTGIQPQETNVRAKEGLVTPPDFMLEEYDAQADETKQTAITFDKLAFSLEDGTELEQKAGQLILPETDANELIIIASYDYSDDITFKKNFTVSLGGGLIDHADFKDPTEFRFFSGAGAWSTTLTLNKDGSFKGSFSDENAGATGEMPSIQISEFSGQFSQIEARDETSYSMILDDITLKHEVGKEWIEDGVLYIASDPYGLTDGEEFILYAPGIAIDEFEFEFISWIGGHSRSSEEQLTMWALRNVNTDHGFFSEEVLDLSAPKETTASSGNLDDQDFVGTWHEVSPTAHAQPVAWIIEKDGDVYNIDTQLAGGDEDRIAFYQMTAKLINDNGVPKLYSNNGTHFFRVFDTVTDIQKYVAGDEDVEYTIEVSHENEVVEFFFEDGYLQSDSSVYGDHRHTYGKEFFFGYERIE